ncbi:nuclear transport factor 2 family protein [Streptomyces sp. BR1]|uniref:nuclear transport factor 2 family protein n=1 Tax=Streptomyces sp. BR1 TaxID=1592323 RepID=UPI00402BB9FA
MSTTRHLVNRQRRLAAARLPVERRPLPVKRRPAPARPLLRPLLLAVLTVALAAFSLVAYVQGADRRADSAGHNTALADTARTSEVKGVVDEAVQGIFSYDHTNPAKSETAAKTALTGAAVEQYRAMIAPVREQGPRQKLVLTTTVTDSGVEVVDGDRARALVFADQSSTRTGKGGGTTVAAAMFAVDAVRRDGTWRIASIDTFSRER